MDKQKVGIDDIAIYVPKLYLPLDVLAEKRNLEYAKLNKGLGLCNMALPDTDEDAATMAANAVLELVRKNDLKPEDIGRIYLGTESALDGAKPTATYILEMVQKYYEKDYGANSLEHCDVLDMTFACIGAVDAMHTTLDWVKANPKRMGIIVSSDFAKYDLSSTGEYTQGAGSIAMLIKSDPRFISISGEVGVSTGPAHDFFKPKRLVSKEKFSKDMSAKLNIDSDIINRVLNALEADDAVLSLHKDTPVFDGQFSNACYKDRVQSALSHFKSMSGLNADLPVLDNWSRLIFHLPYAYHAKRICTELFMDNAKLSGSWSAILEKNELDGNDPKLLRNLSKTPEYRSFVAEKLEKSQRASSEIGNMYSCSIFLALLSSFHFDSKENQNMEGEKIGFFAYGSGAKSKVFEGVVEADWKSIIDSVGLEDILEARQAISYEEYEAIHRMTCSNAIQEQKTGFILAGINEEKGDSYGARSYNFKG